ncbi:MAG: phosphopantetheine-binding protein [Byssovorax sp.]
MPKERTQETLKRLIVDALHLDDTTPESIGDEMPLFGEGLGLDSIDAIELTVAMEQEFGISIGDKEIDKAAFHNVSTLAAFIERRLAAG